MDKIVCAPEQPHSHLAPRSCIEYLFNISIDWIWTSYYIDNILDHTKYSTVQYDNWRHYTSEVVWRCQKEDHGLVPWSLILRENTLKKVISMHTLMVTWTSTQRKWPALKSAQEAISHQTIIRGWKAFISSASQTQNSGSSRKKFQHSLSIPVMQFSLEERSHNGWNQELWNLHSVSDVRGGTNSESCFALS